MPPRRQPFPFDLIFNGVGLMLGRGKKGADLVGTKPNDMSQVAPSDYDYSALPPAFGRIQPYRAFTQGYGLPVQEKFTDPACHYCINADTSAGAWLKGPSLVGVTLPWPVEVVPQPVSHVFELDGKLYALAGRCVFRCDLPNPPSWSLHKDFGEGKVATDAVLFHTNAGGGKEYAYVGMGDSEACWRYDGQSPWEQRVQVEKSLQGGAVVSGWWRYDFGGEHTDPLPYDATNAQVEAALRALTGLENVSVAALDAPEKGFCITYTGAGSITSTLESTLWLWRKQTVTISGTPTGGHFHLLSGPSTTGEIPIAATAAQVQAALRALDGWGSCVVEESGSGANKTYTITANHNSMGPTPVGEILLTYTNDLTGGTPAITVNWVGDAPVLVESVSIPRMTARAWGVVAREFYRSPETNLLAKCDLDADPWNVNNWTADNAFFIADKTAKIVRLAVTAAGALLVYKEDGIYTLGAQGEYVPLYTQLKMAASPDNGKAHAGWLNDEYVVYGGATFRIDAGFTMAACGPETMLRNTSPVKGPLTALCGHDTLNLYGLLHNPDSGDSYLMKFGAYARADSGQQEAQRVEGWHGSLSPAFTGKKGTTMFKTAVGAPTGHFVMYLGFDDGSLAYFVLPCTPNCEEYAFSTADGYVYPAKATFLFEADQKALQGVTVENLTAGPNAYAQFEYKTERERDYTALGIDFVNPIQYAEFPSGTAAAWLDWRLVLKSTLSTLTPQIAGVGIHHSVRPTVRLIYQFLVMAANGLLKRDGTPLRLSAEAIRQVVKAAANLAGPVTVILPDETSSDLLVTGYAESLAWDGRNHQWRAALQVEGAQFKVNTIYGTYRRAGKYIYRELQSYSYRQIQNL